MVVRESLELAKRLSEIKLPPLQKAEVKVKEAEVRFCFSKIKFVDFTFKKWEKTLSGSSSLLK